MQEHVDVLIVGAGLSGIGAAAQLKRRSPKRTFVVLESRAGVGGTWDLFRYPGVRSDSDMFTLGYEFRPWTDAKAIAPGSSIRAYIEATIADEQLNDQIRLQHRVLSASWSSQTATWTVVVARTEPGEYGDSRDDDQTLTLTCSFLFVCSGYYRYDEGFTPAIPGAENFEGAIVHPQHWPDDLDYKDKRVVVVGSGATAVTLVPSMAETAAHVTMLQRSPTYIAPIASRDHQADKLRTYLPPQLAYRIARAKNIGYSMLAYHLSRRRPEKMKSILRNAAIRYLPEDFDVDTHLSPSYEPWDQRLCMIPDADLYRAISRGAADIVTDKINRITAAGIELASGRTLAADVIVTATGLNLLLIGGMTLDVDGQRVALGDTVTYKGMMLDGVPNFAMTIGYTNASWTLKADLVAQYVIRALSYLSRHHFDILTPHAPAPVTTGDLASLIDLQAGYVMRSINELPKQGAKAPWRLHQNYLRDYRLLKFGSITNDMSFRRAGEFDRETDMPRLEGTDVMTLDGIRIRYRRSGHGEPLLLLHSIGRAWKTGASNTLVSPHDMRSTASTFPALPIPIACRAKHPLPASPASWRRFLIDSGFLIDSA